MVAYAQKTASFAWRNKVVLVVGASGVYVLSAYDMNDIKKKADKSFKLYKLLVEDDEGIDKRSNYTNSKEPSQLDSLITEVYSAVDLKIGSLRDLLKNSGVEKAKHEEKSVISDDQSESVLGNDVRRKFESGLVVASKQHDHELSCTQPSSQSTAIHPSQPSLQKYDDEHQHQDIQPQEKPLLDIKDTVGWGVIAAGVAVAFTVPFSSPMLAGIGGGVAIDGLLRKIGVYQAISNVGYGAGYVSSYFIPSQPKRRK
jgi:hypothetical protein